LGAGRSIWVDDPDFDVARHVRLTELPEPGTRRQLLALAERLMAQVLDRSHPLWQMWFVEGVDGGKRVGLVHRSHHALTDGISGVDIATALLDLDVHAPPDVPSSWSPEAGPDPTELLVDTFRTNTARALGVAGRARDAARMPLVAADQVGRLGRSLGSLVTSGVVAPRLSHNASLAPGRRLETLAVPLDLVHAVSDAFGCTVNDVALAAVGGGFARLLGSREELADDLVVKMLCPVSLRVETERAQLGNRISTMLVPVPVGCAPTRARLAAARRRPVHEGGQAVGTPPSSDSASTSRPACWAVGARCTVSRSATS
jgi:WS/DGAT/MGAT family acyltransferase